MMRAGRKGGVRGKVTERNAPLSKKKWAFTIKQKTKMLLVKTKPPTAIQMLSRPPMMLKYGMKLFQLCLEMSLTEDQSILCGKEKELFSDFKKRALTKSF
ncbi:hypothetical protein TNCT_642461 [Trichonephila clavata]|uniref:Uncharacterized protein n=1 Tax=Trichonephila clavata TaxID=2740835 RepID=A0A8X6JH33_TRICU|nr:hypothetical protein TNCT_642461 [Trichonephila clavata]